MNYYSEYRAGYLRIPRPFMDETMPYRQGRQHRDVDERRRVILRQIARRPGPHGPPAPIPTRPRPAPIPMPAADPDALTFGDALIAAPLIAAIVFAAAAAISGRDIVQWTLIAGVTVLAGFLAAVALAVALVLAWRLLPVVLLGVGALLVLAALGIGPGLPL